MQHQQMPTKNSNRPAFLCTAILLCSILGCSTLAVAAGNTLRLDNDSNSRIEIGNVIADNDTTTLFLWTWPDIGDANSGKQCALNFYSLKLQSGLVSLQPQLLAGNVCTSIPGFGGLLADGDGLIIALDQLQRWRSGYAVNNQRFTDLDATRNLDINSNKAGMQFFDIAASGDVVIAAPVLDKNSKTGISLRLVRLDSDGTQVWQATIDDSGQTFTIEKLWAANDGGALLYLTGVSSASIVPVIEPQLRYVSATGELSTVTLVEMQKPLDISSIKPGSLEDLQKVFEQQKNSKPEEIKRLAARPRNDGGFDVLFHREDGKEGRAGNFLQHIGADGNLQSEISLGSQIKDYGLENWVDFYRFENQLMLLSSVMATQEGVSSRRKQWPQNVVSWINLETGMPVSRLIPLDERYLEAAMNAGDAGQQNLEGQPGGDALMLTTLAGKPLAISRGRLKGKFTLRINEATDDLMAFTETMDKKNQVIAKQQTKQKQKDDWEAQKQQMNSELAKSVGMSPEAFAALSNKERKEMLIRNGDPEALQSLMQEFMQTVQMPGQIPDQTSAQVTEQNTVAAPETASNIDPVNALALDAGMRGFIEYHDEQGQPLTLLIVNEQDQQALLSKNYTDGYIYEYIDFSRFQLPLNQINVKYLSENGEVLQELKPTIKH
jgi:hypothetical protein